MENTIEQVNGSGNDVAPSAVDAPNDVVMKALDKLLCDHFESTNYEYSIERGSAKGDNYLGIIYRIRAHAKTANEESSLNLILKVPPSNVTRRNQFFARPTFLRESKAYEEFLPLTAEFQTARGLNVQLEGFHEYPKCLLSMTEEMNEAIFMEDLCAQQFALFNRFDEMDRSHVAIIMRTYAKLHAVSFALRDQDPDKLQPFSELKDVFAERVGDDMFTNYMETLVRTCMGTLDADKDAELLTKLKEYFAEKSAFELLVNYVDGTQCEPYAVVCHGDCWNNNFLFKKNEKGEAIDARVLDWQIIRYASPIIDLVYFIFSCTTSEFRKAHYADMLDLYYATLNKQIERLGSNPEHLFPRSAFDAEFKSKGAAGLIFAMFLLPIVTMRSEDTPDLEELSEKVEAGDKLDLEDSGFLNENNTGVYNKRMRDVIVDLVDYGYL